ncbi:MAG: Lrp/AsnC family transcriptional regulator [Chloroflexi bacterium]|nr:MAG: Lrp/AsnC family transcriptional regulator [Chloroflexota bacterium]
MVKAYILIETEVGKMEEVIESISRIEGVKSADLVTGLYDVIATVEVPDLNSIGSVVKQVHSTPGVSKTTTCIGVRML